MTNESLLPPQTIKISYISYLKVNFSLSVSETGLIKNDSIKSKILSKRKILLKNLKKIILLF